MLYSFGDLALESELRLPSLRSLPEGDAGCFLRLASSPELLGADERWEHHWRAPDGSVSLSCVREEGGYRLGFPGLATARIDNEGRTVTLHPGDHASEGTLEHLVIDQVLPRVLTHRGRIVIHAGCVATPHGAIGFLGDSGAGKSTLCAELARAGRPLLGDDGIVVTPAAGGFSAVATYAGLRLLPEATAAIFDSETQGEPVAHYSDKQRLGCAGLGLAVADGPQPLRGLYTLIRGPRIEIAPLGERDAFLALIRASFLLHLGDRERSRALFDRIGALLDGLPVRRLAYPRELSLLPAVREALLIDADRYLAPACASAS